MNKINWQHVFRVVVVAIAWAIFWLALLAFVAFVAFSLARIAPVAVSRAAGLPEPA